MKSWMISANQNKYDHDASFAENGHVDWIKYGNYSVGDIVYIYYSKPNIMELRRKCIVTKIHTNKSTLTNDKGFWKDKSSYDESRSNSTRGFARLESIELLENPIGLATLRANGLKQPPQLAKLLNNDPIFLNFVENSFFNESGIDSELWEKDDEKVQRAIKSRRGQAKFRTLLLETYNSRCCITGSKVDSILEAAHIVPHSKATNYSKDNGLLLRSDIHTLFDLGFIWVDANGVARVSETLRGSEYSKYDGKVVIKHMTETMRKNLLRKMSSKST